VENGECQKQIFGSEKRDCHRDIVSKENLQQKTSFLRAFVDWLHAWEEISTETKSGLTSETFQAAKHTSEGLATLLEFLIVESKQPYVLLGKIQSDRLEGRFGKLRQMTGGNMFASVRQFLESERTLKVQNLASLDLSLAEIREVFHDSNNEKSSKIEAVSQEIVEGLKVSGDNKFPLLLEDNDENSLFYVAGYFSRTISNNLKCKECKNLLISPNISSVQVVCEEDPNLSPEENDRRISYINDVNRGGLVYPSELMFSASIFAWDLYQKIRKQPKLIPKLFQPNISAQKLFSVSFLKYLDRAENTRQQFVQFECLEGHPFLKILELLSLKFFNIVSKNFVSEKNSEIHAKKKRLIHESETKRSTSAYKAKKLQSNSH